MANDDLFREPDENSGPALAGREPIILPEQRKHFARMARMKAQELRQNLGGD